MVPVLDALIAQDYTLLAVVTQPDKMIGRKKLLNPSAVKVHAKKNNIPVLQPNTLRETQFFEEFITLKPDIAVVAGYGKIIPEKYLEVPKYGFLCVHPSLLPKYRGPSPIQGAILNGEKETGVSVILIDKEMDHGPILSIKKCELEPTVTLREAEKKIWGLGAKLLTNTLTKYIDGNIKPQEQNHDQATFTKLLTREDGHIDWSLSVEKIYNQIRALNPEPGTWTVWKSKIINIKKAKLVDGKIHIQTIQMEGKKEMSFEEFIHGQSGFEISQLT